MNNRGYIVSGTLFIILLVSILIIGLFYIPLLSSSYSIKNSFNSLQENINVKNSFERIHFHLYKNISYQGILDYSDLGLRYELKDLETNYRTVNSNDNKFKIINPTDIEIELSFIEYETVSEGKYEFNIEDNYEVDTENNFSPEGEEGYYDAADNIVQQEDNYEVDLVDSYYTVRLTNKNEILFDEVFTSDEIITIRKSYFENIDNFGEYILEIDSYNGSTIHNITYEELSYRKIELIEEKDKVKSKKHIIIENNTSINDTFKMYFSDIN